MKPGWGLSGTHPKLLTSSQSAVELWGSKMNPGWGLSGALQKVSSQAALPPEKPIPGRNSIIITTLASDPTPPHAQQGAQLPPHLMGMHWRRTLTE